MTERDLPDGARQCAECGRGFVAGWAEDLCGGCRE